MVLVVVNSVGASGLVRCVGACAVGSCWFCLTFYCLMMLFRLLGMWLSLLCFCLWFI